MAAAGPTKITFYINRGDACGWSWTVYTQTADLPTAERQSLFLRSIISDNLASDTAIIGARYTDTANPRKSILRKYAAGVLGSPGAPDPDERTVCASWSLLNTNGQKAVHSFRGLPDDWVIWSPPPSGMILNPNGLAAVTNIIQELCNSKQQTYGWLPRLRKNDAGSNTQIITALGANPFGNATLTVATTAGFPANPMQPIIVAGMRGMQKFLNGTYLPSAYVIVNGTTLGLVNRQTGAGVITSYSGQGTVRLAGQTFVPYQQNQAFPSSTGIELSTIKARDTGRPFFLTHGRRGK